MESIKIIHDERCGYSVYYVAEGIEKVILECLSESELDKLTIKEIKQWAKEA